MKQRTPGYIFIPLTLLSILAAFMMVIPTNFLPKAGFVGIVYNAFYQLINVFSHWIVWVVLLVAFLMLLVVARINKMVERAKFLKLSKEEQQKYLAVKKQGYLTQLFLSSKEKQSAEEEEAIILDHGFDGIKELDNSLPQWWLAMFYFGVVYMVTYITAYFTTDFAHPDEEYEVQTARLETQFTEWIKANDIKLDGANNLYESEVALKHGQEIFESICATCHTKSGGGAAGPNLTDDYWINHRQEDLFKNIYQMVYDGSPNNPAMQAFGQTKQLTGLDIQDVASYVYYLNQVKPQVTKEEGGLAEQGDKISAWERKQ